MCATSEHKKTTSTYVNSHPMGENTPKSGHHFSETIYQNGEKYTNLPQHYQMTIKFSNIFPF
jgi:hypothetical protein